MLLSSQAAKPIKQACKTKTAPIVNQAINTVQAVNKGCLLHDSATIPNSSQKGKQRE